MALRRIFLSSDDPTCRFGCVYCFTRFSQYNKGTFGTIEKSAPPLSQQSIIYPACDYDLFTRDNPLEKLAPLVDNSNYISLSTKAHLPDQTILGLKKLHSRQATHSGLLKIGISITTKFRINEIEKGAASYEERVSNATRLKAIGVPVALILKPLLSRISLDEYKSIIKDFSSHVDAVVLGSEYINERTLNSREDTLITRHMVHWLPGTPRWPSVNMSHYIRALEVFCRNINTPCFTSDRDAITHLAHAHTREGGE